jgi:hypothetical protein
MIERSFTGLTPDIIRIIVKMLVEDGREGAISAARLLMTSATLYKKYSDYFNKLIEKLAHIKKLQHHRDCLILLTNGGQVSLVRILKESADEEPELFIGGIAKRIIDCDLRVLSKQPLSNFWSDGSALFLLAEDGQLFACGDQRHYKLGVNSAERFIETPQPVCLSARVKHIIQCSRACYFLCEDGQVYLSGIHPVTLEMHQTPVCITASLQRPCQEIHYDAQRDVLLLKLKNNKYWEFDRSLGLIQFMPSIDISNILLCGSTAFYFEKRGRVLRSCRADRNTPAKIIDILPRSPFKIDGITCSWTFNDFGQIHHVVFTLDNKTKILCVPFMQNSHHHDDSIFPIVIPLDEGEILKTVLGSYARISILTNSGKAYIWNFRANNESTLEQLEGNYIDVCANDSVITFIAHDHSLNILTTSANNTFNTVKLPEGVKADNIAFRTNNCVTALNNENPKELYVAYHPFTLWVRHTTQTMKEKCIDCSVATLLL